jgi:hypothetical protein
VSKGTPAAAGLEVERAQHSVEQHRVDDGRVLAVVELALEVDLAGAEKLLTPRPRRLLTHGRQN